MDTLKKVEMQSPDVILWPLHKEAKYREETPGLMIRKVVIILNILIGQEIIPIIHY